MVLHPVHLSETSRTSISPSYKVLFNRILVSSLKTSWTSTCPCLRLFFSHRLLIRSFISANKTMASDRLNNYTNQETAVAEQVRVRQQTEPSMAYPYSKKQISKNLKRACDFTNLLVYLPGEIDADRESNQVSTTIFFFSRTRAYHSCKKERQASICGKEMYIVINRTMLAQPKPSNTLNA